MAYSSSLSDQEWKIIEPLLPQKKQTRPPLWSKRQILDGIFYQLKNGCNWCDLPRDLPPYSTVFWYYKQWRDTGILDEIMDKLHSKVREQAQKNRSGQPWSWLTPKRLRTPVMPALRPRVFVITRQPMGLNGIWRIRYVGISLLYSLYQSQCYWRSGTDWNALAQYWLFQSETCKYSEDHNSGRPRLSSWNHRSSTSSPLSPDHD